MPIMIFISLWLVVGVVIGIGLGCGSLMVVLDKEIFRNGIKPQGPRLIIWAIFLVVISLWLANTTCTGQIAGVASDNESHPAICQ